MIFIDPYEVLWWDPQNYTKLENGWRREGETERYYLEQNVETCNHRFVDKATLQVIWQKHLD